MIHFARIIHAPIVYRLGHKVFILVSGVRLPVGVPFSLTISTMPNWIRKFLSHEAGPLQQFLKYAIAGGMATASHILVFYLCAIWLFPCLTADDWAVRLLGLTVSEMPGGTRVLNAGICNALAFVCSNAFCYVLNRRFVFRPGRHPWGIELLLFFGVSGISMVLGTAIQSWLIAQFALQTTLAFGANLITSLLINYAMRRFFIFRG